MQNILMGFIIGLIVASTLGSAVVLGTVDRYKAEAIKHNCALYDTKTAQFEWVQVKDNK